MEYQPQLQENTLRIDSFELLIRFLIKCKDDIKKNEPRSQFVSSCADIVTAVYYYRRFPDVNEFIEKYLKGKEEYFQLQWARKTWASLSKMTETEISNLVINQIYLVDNLEEEQ